MATAICCGICGFRFCFVDSDHDWPTSTCPICQVQTPRIAVPQGEARTRAGTEWFVVDRFGQALAGPFSGPERATLWVTRNRLWDHPRGPLDIKWACAGSMVVPATSSVDRPLEALVLEWPGDPSFWSGARLVALGRLWYSATQPESCP